MSVAARPAVAPVRTPLPHRYVYVIGPAAGLQKVGLATDPKARLAALQTACPFDLVLHAAVRVPFGQAHAVERQAHRVLARVCVRNEWFQTKPVIEASRLLAALGRAVNDLAPSRNRQQSRNPNCDEMR